MLDGRYVSYIWLAAIILVPIIVVFFASTRMRAATWTGLFFLIGVGALTGPQLLDALSMPAGSPKNQLILKFVSAIIASALAGGLIAYRFFSAKAWYRKTRL